MNGEDLLLLWQQAVQQGREPVYVVQFANGMTAEVRLERS